MKYFKKLIGERIYLSPLNLEDAEKYVEWFCNFKMTDGIGKSGNIMTLEAEREWIDRTLKNNELNFAIVNLENDELIGNCEFADVSHQNRTGTVGIFIGKKN